MTSLLPSARSLCNVALRAAISTTDVKSVPPCSRSFGGSQGTPSSLIALVKPPSPAKSSMKCKEDELGEGSFGFVELDAFTVELRRRFARGVMRSARPEVDKSTLVGRLRISATGALRPSRFPKSLEGCAPHHFL